MPGEQQNLGTSRWLAPEIVADIHPFDLGRVWTGRMPLENDALASQGPAIGFKDDRHVLVVGGNRSGKGATFIVPNLCMWPGSVVVLDPKGENAMLTAARRGRGGVDERTGVDVQGMGQPTFVLDPYGQARGCGTYLARFNPMDELLKPGMDEPAGDALDQVMLIVDALVVENDAGNADPYWNNAAKDVLRGLILHVLTEPSYAGFRNLVTVRRLLTLGDVEAHEWMRAAGKENIPSPEELLWRGVANNEAFGGIVAGIGRRYLSDLRENYKVFASIVSNAVVHTAFIDSEGLRDNLRSSDFRLEDLKTKASGISIFLCLPQRYMATHYRWMRIVSNLAVAEMERVGHQPKSGHRVLFMLDEFATLRRLEAIETAVSYIAGFGVKMAFVLQSLDQLKRVYPNAWETFYANCALRVFMGVEDNFTREYISKAAGDTEVILQNRTSSTSQTKSRAEQKGGSRTTTKGQSQGTNRGGSKGRSFGGSKGRSWGGNEGTSENEGWSENDTVSDGNGRSRVRHENSMLAQLLFLKRRYNWDDDETFSSNTSRSHATGRSGGTSRNRGRNWGSNEGTNWGENENSTWGQNESVSLSEALGETWSVTETVSEAQSQGVNEARHKRPLIAPEEIGRYFARVDQGHKAYPGLGLLLVSGENPAIVRRTNYFEDKAFARLFMPHPDYPLLAKSSVEALPEPAKPAAKPRYGRLVGRSLLLGYFLAAATMLVTVGYCMALWKLGYWMATSGHFNSFNLVIGICGFVHFSTLLALWFFVFTNRSPRRLIAAIVVTILLTALGANANDSNTWGTVYMAIFIKPVVDAIKLFEDLDAQQHLVKWIVILVIFTALWGSALFMRGLRQVEAGEA